MIRTNLISYERRKPHNVNGMRLTHRTPSPMSRVNVWKNSLREHWRVALLALLPIAALVAAITSPPIAQDLGYHGFADTRVVFGIPNFANVVSNVPFLIVGIAGLAICLRSRKLG